MADHVESLAEVEVDTIHPWVLRGCHPPPRSLTSREHLGALAEAVVVVGVAGAEAGALRCHAALPPGRAAVVLQREPAARPSAATATVTAGCLLPGGSQSPSALLGAGVAGRGMPPAERGLARRDAGRDPAAPAWRGSASLDGLSWGPRGWGSGYAAAEDPPRLLC